MALVLVPVPIGNKDDFTIRGLDELRSADAIILEEHKESTAWLRSQGVSGKKFYQLNEHSTEADLLELLAICAEGKVALITDSGTPGFCDPGPRLIERCRKKGISVRALPGPSSLMTLLSLSSRRMDQFYFRGFLPAENQSRELAWNELKEANNRNVPVILMDTPYRLGKMCRELEQHFPSGHILLGLNLSQDSEIVIDGRVSSELSKVPHGKMEFILVLWRNG